jgi:Ca2+-binding EF-hand superfamily protein
MHPSSAWRSLCAWAAVASAGILGGNDPMLDAHWTSAFPTIDSDGDAFIGREELMHYLRRRHHLMTREKRGHLVEQMKKVFFAEFAMADLNGDGFLSKDESSKTGKVTKKRLLRAVGANAKVTLTEYTNAKIPQLSTDEVAYIHQMTQNTMDLWDNDDDLTLSFQEFDKWKARGRKEIHTWENTVDEEEGFFEISIGTDDEKVMEQKAEHDADFDQFDHDKNQQLDIKELQKYMGLKGGSVWTSEAEEFMMYVDYNKVS